MTPTQSLRRVLFLLPLVFLSCAPTVRLSTPDPVKIDVNMNVHVTTEAVKKSVDGDPGSYSPRQARRERMAELQALKNNRIVGEGNDGLIVLKEPPVDPAYQSYIARVVKEENADRQMILNDDAESKKQPVSVVARDFARRNREAAFPGEWVQQEDGTWIKR
ncbi:MAG: DUF1318 domain-containing protein [Candidatus Methylacidiphilales bacterium]|nr:DUF1318 domain-containing protein [Candidatus Methylacidiphilales bacterium]